MALFAAMTLVVQEGQVPFAHLINAILEPSTTISDGTLTPSSPFWLQRL